MQNLDLCLFIGGLFLARKMHKTRGSTKRGALLMVCAVIVVMIALNSLRETNVVLEQLKAQSLV